jgi:hypothetical protein
LARNGDGPDSFGDTRQRLCKSRCWSSISIQVAAHPHNAVRQHLTALVPRIDRAIASVAETGIGTLLQATSHHIGRKLTTSTTIQPQCGDGHSAA